MSKGLVLEFTKMHGAGNDFIVIDNRFFRFSAAELSDLAARYCPRRLGIGADGLLALDLAGSNEVDYRMRYFNADGSHGEMCGNGARCLAAYARESGVSSQPLSFVTDAGPYRAFVKTDGPHVQVRLILPGSQDVTPNFVSLEVSPEVSLDLTFMVTGVPHAVWFGDHIDRIPIETWGSAVRYDSCFENTSGTNVDFAEVLERDGEAVMRVRTYERGVEAETLSCGTGAVSALVAAYESGRITQRSATIRMAGGDLQVGYVEGANEMFLEGPVAFAYRGTVTL